MKKRSLSAIIGASLLAVSMVSSVFADELVVEDAVVLAEAVENIDVEIEELPAIDATPVVEVEEAGIDIEEAKEAQEDGASIIATGSVNFGQVYDVDYSSDEGDVYYKLHVPSSGTLTVAGYSKRIDSGISLCRVEFNIYDLGGECLIDSEINPNRGGECLYKINLLAGDYYFNFYGNYDYEGVLEFKIDYEPAIETVADSIAEPHNSTISAIKFDGSLFKGFLCKNDHKDVFEYNVPYAANVGLRYQSFDTNDVYVAIDDASGNEVLDSTRVDVGTRDFSLFLEKGKYYITIDADNDHEGGSYQISATLEAAKNTWEKDSKGWKCKQKNGEYCSGGFFDIDGATYYFDYSDYMQTGWQYISGYYYYFSGSGVMARSKWIGNYYLKSDGKMATNEWVDGGKYYVDGNGKWLSGKTQGSSSSSSVKAGWKKDGKGWWYQNSNGSYPKACWAKIDGSWYHFNGSGYMQTGWLKDGSSWYYLKSSGAMATGWLKDGGKWYYLKPSGSMATGWINVGGKDYYMYGDGHMAANEWIGKYHVNASGAWDKSK